MCGRYILRQINARRFGVEWQPSLFEEFSDIRLNPLDGLLSFDRYNVAPTARMPIICVDAKENRSIKIARWGFVPTWIKGKPKMRPHIARDDTVQTSGMFRSAIQRQRCLVPADGFYEWQGEKSAKQPFFVHLKADEPFAFAGIWERAVPIEGEDPTETFAIITTTPNEVMKPLNHRMPVILDEADYDRWLSPSNPADRVSDLLKPSPAEKMEAWPVSVKVNKVASQGKELTKPVAMTTPESSGELF